MGKLLLILALSESGGDGRKTNQPPQRQIQSAGARKEKPAARVYAVTRPEALHTPDLIEGNISY